MGRRGAIVAAIIVAGVLTLVVSPRFLPRDHGPVYFHHGDGVVRLSNGRTAEARVSGGSTRYGAATLSAEKPPELRLDFTLGALGLLRLDVGPFSGAGVYGELRDVYLNLEDGPFRCYESCGGCTVNIDGASDEAMSGALSCLSLSNCSVALLPRDGADARCRDATATIIDLAGTFRLDQASHKGLDY